MKIANNYMLKEIAGNYVAIPVGQNVVDYKGMLHLNETGAFICKCLETDTTREDLLNKMYEKYEAEESDKPIINADVDEFIERGRTIGLIVE